MENIYSPLTNKNNVKKIDILDIARLKKQYLSQYRVDVSRFFNNIKELAIYECQDSKLQFYYPFSPIGDGLFYSELGKGYSGYYSPWRWEHERAYRLINPNDHVLDIGCGSGYFLKKVQDKSARATGLDFNPDAVEYGKQKGLKILSETIKEHSERYGNYYDIICAFQLFEHVNDVREFLDDTLKCLKKDGLLVIGVPNNDSYYFKKDPYHTLNLPPHHMLLWNHKALAYLEEIFDLKIVDITNQPVEKVHKGMMYNNLLSGHLGSFLGKAVGLLTRFFVKQLPLFSNQGITVVATYRKT